MTGSAKLRRLLDAAAARQILDRPDTESSILSRPPDFQTVVEAGCNERNSAHERRSRTRQIQGAIQQAIRSLGVPRTSPGDDQCLLARGATRGGLLQALLGQPDGGRSQGLFRGPGRVASLEYPEAGSQRDPVLLPPRVAASVGLGRHHQAAASAAVTGCVDGIGDLQADQRHAQAALPGLFLHDLQFGFALERRVAAANRCHARARAHARRQGRQGSFSDASGEGPGKFCVGSGAPIVIRSCCSRTQATEHNACKRRPPL